jgi:hypothetical protein
MAGVPPRPCPASSDGKVSFWSWPSIEESGHFSSLRSLLRLIYVEEDDNALALGEGFFGAGAGSIQRGLREDRAGLGKATTSPKPAQKILIG